jgi:hypothetical protein
MIGSAASEAIDSTLTTEPRLAASAGKKASTMS